MTDACTHMPNPYVPQSPAIGDKTIAQRTTSCSVVWCSEHPCSVVKYCRHFLRRYHIHNLVWLWSEVKGQKGHATHIEQVQVFDVGLWSGVSNHWCGNVFTDHYIFVVSVEHLCWGSFSRRVDDSFYFGKSQSYIYRNGWSISDKKKSRRLDD